MQAKCPPGSHNKCYNGVCIARYEYCSSKSKTAEPCVNEDFLTNKDFRETVCRAISQGKNVTGVTIHPSCDMETDCIKEFNIKFYTSKQSDNNSPSWHWILPTSICVVLLVALLVIAIWYFRKRAKRRQLEKERSVAFNNGGSAVDILANNRINESMMENDANQRQQSTDPEPDGTDNSTEETQLLRRQTTNAGNAGNSPDSGIAPAVPIHTDSPSGSGSNTNSTRSSGTASVFIDMESQQANQPSTSAISTHHGCHPAEIESSLQRAVHMPTSIPHGSAELVTNHSTYNHGNNGNLE